MVEIALLAIAVLVVLLTFGVPLPWCFGAALMVMSLVGGVTMKGNILWGMQQLSNPILLAIPLFVLAGTIMSASGIAASLLRFVNVFIGHIRGGLGVVATMSCAVIGAISGSGFTGVAAIGPLLIPEMERRGYPREYATALITNSSVLGLLIPPSVTMIVYGWVTDTSILACFLATLGPGLFITLNFSVINLWMARKFPLVLDEKPSLAAFSGEATRRGIHAFPALLMPVIILGGIYGGIMTPTEAAAVAVIYAVPVGFLIYRGLTWSNFLEAGREAATSVGTIMVMILFSMILSQIFVVEGVPQALVEGIFEITENKLLLLILVNLLLFLVGMIVNDITAIILLAPLLLPLMSAIEVSPVQFAAIMGVNTAMGGVTPPYASILYLGARVGNVKVTKVIPPAMLFLALGYVPVVFLTAFWPDLSLSLPRFFGY
ncbi:C4-dicarboxylate TRAP transporter large permease protein DctM [Roseovarius sp. EC-HK134]|jgi:tripartite ATP-independent transporter DctM subunit|uniref:TRAP transporter large permease protein n=2 Tax=Rhodobacterales TaxID=204455 RepID=A0A1V0RVH0_9RHOB|nr:MULTISPECIES: TRAP transporter large permease [Rhodobacterales]MCR9191016.1 TRAP transporter large permease [Alteromonadaceae bacterium]ARE85675.1 C4-dicarboxylate TRAP transporter large permease protein DctM [Roseovarius mucosus]ARU03260.1 C4-dicarboxylate TRAP transporter large permease protein DctM [Yoonia vestfoldensis]MBW4976105.1 TRAP transporter large permease [Roseovarius mucosus]VVS96580.1 C4-dicarboxylate TRAP transporter large permease protein DctM [Roseovarius sp. EC-SD190]